MDDRRLQLKFYETHDGKDVLKCIQCGTCSGSCPLSDKMDYAPRELFALIRDGEMEAVLRSNTQWYCVSCYQCMVRCPQEIPVTDLMYILKQMAIKQGISPKTAKMPDLYMTFYREVLKKGRLTEAMLMIRYGMKHPTDTLSNAFLAVKLLKRRRLEIIPQSIKEPKRISYLKSADSERTETK